MTSDNESSSKRPYCFALPERSHINARDPDEYPNAWCDSCDHFVDCQEANENKPHILTLNLKEQYFRQIADGTKTEEYREVKDYWISRLSCKHFDVIEICNGYPDRGDLDNRLWFRYAGIKQVLMKWDNAGVSVSVRTFVIKLGDRLEYPYQAMENPQ